MKTEPVALPSATYRVQLRCGVRLADVTSWLPYLEALGVSHLYLSPLGRAQAGSTHGYDVVDPTELDPELGTEEDLARLAAECRRRGMGIVVDLIPNHMCIATSENAWWNDVLENGPSSPFARYFDIDWSPPKRELSDKVLLPILGDQYGRVLEAQQLQVEREAGSFHIRYFDRTLPLAPKTWVGILAPVVARLRRRSDEDAPSVLELESIVTALGHLPARTERDPDKVRERQREKEIIKQRLASLLAESGTLASEIDDELHGLNGRSGEPRSFDRLEALLAEQAYRLSFWRVACDEINYRRFFDVNELAAIRIEEPEVAAAVHQLPLRWFREKKVQGLRIDHVDGLYDPLDYLEKLPGEAFVVVEKILVGDERLPEDWPVQGTTGYEFLNVVNGLFVASAAGDAFRGLYRRWTGAEHSFRETVYESKKLVLQVALSAELTVLSRKLDRISERHRDSRDFTLRNLHDSLAEVIACFPVYRTYTRRGRSPSQADRSIVERAVKEAKRKNPSTSESVFDFIASVLLSGDPEAAEFVASFQQLSGPVMAKGLEDTALYRYYPLASLADVGGNPDRFGVSIARFHQWSLDRQKRWPHALSATSTHDTKRDEDVRSRLDVLSEIPRRWEEALNRFRELNLTHRAHRPSQEAPAEGDESETPDRNEEYLLYQTLVGIWPSPYREEDSGEGLTGRVREYMRKALREAKVHTSWVNPRESYEEEVDRFIGRILDPAGQGRQARPKSGARFREALGAFVDSIAGPGQLNAVAQTLLKIASPGIPDFYQGTELPERKLVDPDNRTTVDFERRARSLSRLLERARKEGAGPLARRLLESPEDGELKLFVTRAALDFRRRRPELFAEGDYVPLSVRGEREGHVVAFARTRERGAALVVATRFFTTLPRIPLGESVWGETSLDTGPLAGAGFRDALTGIELESIGASVPLSQLFGSLPFVLLERRA